MILFHRIKQIFNDIVWFILYRTIYRYHVLKLGFKPGWKDADEKLVYANFQILADCVEKEKLFINRDFSATEEDIQAGNELAQLYEWWKETRPKRNLLDPTKNIEKPEIEFKKIEGKNLFKMVYVGREEHTKKWLEALGQLNKLQETWRKEDTENIKRLANVRSYLWI